MTGNPCEYGMDCPYHANAGEEADYEDLCTYPKLSEQATEDELFPTLEDHTCPMCEPPSKLWYILNAYENDIEVTRAVERSIRTFDEECQSVYKEIQRRRAERSIREEKE